MAGMESEPSFRTRDFPSNAREPELPFERDHIVGAEFEIPDSTSLGLRGATAYIPNPGPPILRCFYKSGGLREFHGLQATQLARQVKDYCKWLSYSVVERGDPPELDARLK